MKISVIKEFNISSEIIVDLQPPRKLLCKNISTQNTKLSKVLKQSLLSYSTWPLKKSQEYKDHFKRFGFTRGEAHHVEKMVGKYGVNYIFTRWTNKMSGPVVALFKLRGAPNCLIACFTVFTTVERHIWEIVLNK